MAGWLAPVPHADRGRSWLAVADGGPQHNRRHNATAAAHALSQEGPCPADTWPARCYQAGALVEAKPTAGVRRYVNLHARPHPPSSARVHRRTPHAQSLHPGAHA